MNLIEPVQSTRNASISFADFVVKMLKEVGVEAHMTVRFDEVIIDVNPDDHETMVNFVRQLL